MCNSDKYYLNFGQIQFAILTNAICNKDKYILQFAQTHFSKGAHLFENLDLYILQVEHILHMFRYIHICVTSTISHFSNCLHFELLSVTLIL